MQIVPLLKADKRKNVSTSKKNQIVSNQKTNYSYFRKTTILLL